MKRNYFIINLSLLFSLFIYLGYRTEKTLICKLCISLISWDKFIAYRKVLATCFPLPELIIYCLPEGLWVFSITLTSKHLFLKVGKPELNLLFLPLIFSIGLEIFQLLHITNGRFDFWDIGFSILFWGLATFLLPPNGLKQNALQPFTMHSFICILSYLIVYLAHVCK